MNGPQPSRSKSAVLLSSAFKIDHVADDQTEHQAVGKYSGATEHAPHCHRAEGCKQVPDEIGVHGELRAERKGGYCTMIETVGPACGVTDITLALIELAIRSI